MSYFRQHKKLAGSYFKKLAVVVLLLTGALCYAEPEPITHRKECLEFLNDARMTELYLSMGMVDQIEDRYYYVASDAQWLEKTGRFRWLTTVHYIDLTGSKLKLTQLSFEVYVERKAFLEYLRGYCDGQSEVIDWEQVHGERIKD